MENQNRSNYQDSKLHLYKQLTSLRKKEPVFATGSTALFSSGGVFAFARFDSDVTYVTAANVMDNNVNVDMSEIVKALDGSGEVIIRSSGVANNATVVGNTVDMANITLSRFEAIVVKLGGSVTTSASIQYMMSPLTLVFLHLAMFFLACWG